MKSTPLTRSSFCNAAFTVSNITKSLGEDSIVYLIALTPHSKQTVAILMYVHTHISNKIFINAQPFTGKEGKTIE